MKKIGYMCKVDFYWEIGEALGGCDVYESIEDLRKHRKCVDTCGIVKVTIELEEVIQESNYKRSK